MRKIKLAIVISHPIQHFCPQFVSFTQNREIDFKVFFGSALGHRKYVDENFKQEVFWDNLKLDQFPHHFLNGDKILQPDRNLDAPTLDTELDIYRPDIVFTFGYFQKLQRRTYRWAVRNKIFLVYISDSEMRHYSQPFISFFKRTYLRRYFSKPDLFLTMGNANEAYYNYHHVPVSKMLRMHYPIDREYYLQKYNERALLRKHLRSRFGIGKEDLVLTVIGKLVPWKNQDHLIRAMHLLEKGKHTYHLFILGSGEKKDDWEKLVIGLKRNKVYFEGFVKAGNLPEYLAATDIYIHPASLEPHSVAISEAIFMGCPIILSDRCGSYGKEDDVQIGRNGYVYPFGNIEELVSRIEELSINSSLRKSFSEYSHTIALSFQQNSHFNMLQNLVAKFNEANAC